jgi:cytochrome P450
MVELNPYDWKLHEDPYPVYKRLRDEAPAYRNEELGFWALTRHADVLGALRQPELYSSRDGVALEPLDRAATEVSSILAMDPPRHDALRSIIWRPFTPRRVRDLEARVRELADRYLDPMVEQGGGDFIKDFAGRVPMDVVSEMIGIPPEDRDMVREWADVVVHRDELKPEVPPAAIEAGMKLLGYFYEHVNRRRGAPKGDLSDVLIAADVDGEPIPDMDIVAVHFLLSIAGNETTTKLLGNAVYWLSRNPAERKKVEANPELAPRWVEETLRYDASSQMVARTVTRDIELHDKTLREGDRVALFIGSANRDERAFPDADRYDVEREAGQTLAFGHGVHYCLGASLARLEGRICLEQLIKRMPRFELHDAKLTRMHSSNVRGFSSMPLSL